MKKIKPSELPVNTVIDDQDHGTWIKDSPHEWLEISSLVNNKYQRLAFDGGPTDQEKSIWAHRNIITEPSDDYFKDFRILSVPFSMVEYMAVHTARLLGSDEAKDALIQRTFDHHDEVTPEVEWKRIEMFQSVDVEINAIGHVRNRRTGEIYEPKFNQDFLRELVTFKDDKGIPIYIDHKLFVKELFKRAL